MGVEDKVQGIVLIDTKILLIAKEGRRIDTRQRVAHYYLPRAQSIEKLIEVIGGVGAFPQLLTKEGQEFYGAVHDAEPCERNPRTGEETYIMTASTSLFEPRCTRWRPGKKMNKYIRVMEPNLHELYAWLQSDERFQRYAKGGRLIHYAHR